MFPTSKLQFSTNLIFKSPYKSENMAQEWQDDSDHAEPQWSYAERIYIGAEQNFSAEFYDGLSQVAITSIALKELDRRTAGRRETPSRPERRPDDLKRFCRHGGPDLCHIRNVSHAGSTPF